MFKGNFIKNIMFKIKFKKFYVYRKCSQNFSQKKKENIFNKNKINLFPFIDFENNFFFLSFTMRFEKYSFILETLDMFEIIF